MNMFKRWYDADAVVSKVINDMEKAQEEVQIRCAEYIIDDLLKDVELKNLSLDEKNVKCQKFLMHFELQHLQLHLWICLFDLQFPVRHI